MFERDLRKFSSNSTFELIGPGELRVNNRNVVQTHYFVKALAPLVFKILS